MGLSVDQWVGGWIFGVSMERTDARSSFVPIYTVFMSIVTKPETARYFRFRFGNYLLSAACGCRNALASLSVHLTHVKKSNLGLSSVLFIA